MSIKGIQHYNHIFKKFGLIKYYDINCKKYRLNTFKSIPFVYKGIFGLIDNIGNIYLSISDISYYICGNRRKIASNILNNSRNLLLHHHFVRLMRTKLNLSNVRGSEIYKYMKKKNKTIISFYQLNAISCILASSYKLNTFTKYRSAINRFMHELNSGRLIRYAKKCYKQHLQKSLPYQYSFDEIRHHTPITDKLLKKILKSHDWIEISSSVSHDAVEFLKKNHIWE